MFKKFALWFICFGLSFLVESWGWAEQGKAFLYINIGADIIIILIALAIIVIAGIAEDCAAEANGISFIVILATIGILAIVLFATWGATKLFNVDFYTAYMIMTFGQCLCSNNKKSDN